MWYYNSTWKKKVKVNALKVYEANTVEALYPLFQIEKLNLTLSLYERRRKAPSSDV